jgi:uncharacterized protein (TIGR02444 family)
MQTADEFVTRAWTAIGDLYRRPSVSQLCLGLQETYGVDVPLLLFLLHAEQNSMGVDTDDFTKFLTNAHAWREDAVKPLRTIRQSMKGRYAEQDEIDLRDAVKALELKAEQIHVSRLARSFMAHAKPMAASGMSAAYLHNCGVPADACEKALAALKATDDDPHFQDHDEGHNGYA